MSCIGSSLPYSPKKVHHVFKNVQCILQKCSWYTAKTFVVIETKKKEEFKKKEKIPGKNQPRRTESKKGNIKKKPKRKTKT